MVEETLSGSLSGHWLTGQTGPVYTPDLTKTICLFLNRDCGGRKLPFLLIYQKVVLAFWL